MYYNIRNFQINAWLESLSVNYPETVEVIVGGQSYEGRNITGVKISFKEGNPGVFLESGEQNGMFACDKDILTIPSYFIKHLRFIQRYRHQFRMKSTRTNIFDKRVFNAEANHRVVRLTNQFRDNMWSARQVSNHC